MDNRWIKKISLKLFSPSCPFILLKEIDRTEEKVYS